MFQTAKGIQVPFPEKIMQTYKVCDNCLQFTLNFEKIEPMLNDFIARIEEPMFIALHVPLHEDEEKKMRAKAEDPFHESVCYLDGLNKSTVRSILRKYGKLILHSGMSPFAIASHNTGDEFFLQKYQVVTIYSKQPMKWTDLLERYDICRADQLFTAWQTFDKDHPGKCSVVTIHGHDIYDVHKELEKLGMYEAKVVEAE